MTSNPIPLFSATESGGFLFGESGEIGEPWGTFL